jgi:hypothetical protein
LLLDVVPRALWDVIVAITGNGDEMGMIRVFVDAVVAVLPIQFPSFIAKAAQYVANLRH